MHITNKIYLLLFITAIGVGAYFSYPVIKNRYFSEKNKDLKEESFLVIENQDSEKNPESNQSNQIDQEKIPEPPSLEESLSGSPTESSNTNQSKLNLNERGTPDSENLAHITTQHCATNCESFAIDFGFLEYCQQVCGIAPVKNVSDCTNKSGIEKDYCQKDLAIGKKDSKLCEEINDANIKLTCQNRIIEDLLESQTRPENPDF